MTLPRLQGRLRGKLDGLAGCSRIEIPTREENMKAVLRCMFVIAGLLTAGAAFAQDFRGQAAAAAAQWDNAFNSSDASKVAQSYTNNAILLPAGGQQVTGQQGAETLFES